MDLTVLYETQSVLKMYLYRKIQVNDTYFLLSVKFTLTDKIFYDFRNKSSNGWNPTADTC